MDRTYGIVEVIGVSEISYADATRKAVSALGKQQQNLSWFEVLEQRGRIESGEVLEFQVRLRVGYRML